jgi:GTP-binding protein HflX
VAFNKIDRAGDAAAQARVTAALAQRWPDSVILSARDAADVADLRQRLVAFFARDLVEGEVRVPYDRQQLRGQIFADCEVLGERYDEEGVIFRVRAHPTLLERLRAA